MEMGLQSSRLSSLLASDDRAGSSLILRRRTSLPLKRRLLTMPLDIGLSADIDDDDDVDTGDIGEDVEVDLAFFRGLYL